MSIGFSQNNPTNLKGNSEGWTGQLQSDNDFASFDTLEHGIRAWIVNLHYQSIVNGLGTYGEFLSSQTPIMDNNPSNYNSKVVGNNFNLQDEIKTDPQSLWLLFQGVIKNEIPEWSQISQSEFNTALSDFNDSLEGWVTGSIETIQGNTGFSSSVLIIFLIFFVYVFSSDK